MDLLLWLTVGFFVIGFVVLVSMKKGMESKVAYIKANVETEESWAQARSVIWWIGSTVAWGMVSMSLFVWWFNQ